MTSGETFSFELRYWKTWLETSPPEHQEMADRQAGRRAGRETDGREARDRPDLWVDTGRVFVSLDDLEVVQDGHDVLRHEDVAGVHGHAGHGDQQGV